MIGSHQYLLGGSHGHTFKFKRSAHHSAPTSSPHRDLDRRPGMDSISASVAATAAQEEEACLRAMQLTSFSVLPMTLKAAIELGVFEAIAGAGAGAHLSAAEIVARIPATITNPQALIVMDRILCLLVSYSILSCSISPTGERCYGPEPVVKYLTPSTDGVSLAWLGLMFQDRVMLESWHHLKDTVVEGGIPFNKTYGMTMFKYFGTNPRFNTVFNNAMSGHSSIITNNVLEIYGGFSGLGLLVDVGGGVGSTLKKITAKYSGIMGINFDLPHVISEARALPRVEHVGGDMFSNIPSGDAIFMKSILHDWSDEHCSKLLKNCWKALPENGKVIVVEYILPEQPESTLVAQNVFLMDLIMLALTPGGKERSEGEFESLAMQAGFSEFKAMYIFSGYWLMEFTKKTK